MDFTSAVHNLYLGAHDHMQAIPDFKYREDIVFIEPLASYMRVLTHSHVLLRAQSEFQMGGFWLSYLDHNPTIAVN